MQNPLVRWFLIWLTALLVALVAYGIFAPAAIPLDLYSVDFNTTQSSELYFKNMRSYYYEKEEDSASKFNIYRIKSRTAGDSSILNFALVNNWLFNEAYILAESSYLKIDSKQLEVYPESNEQPITLLERDATAHYLFAAALFELLLKEEQFYINHNGQQRYFSESEKKSLKQSLKDFFKLVGKVR